MSENRDTSQSLIAEIGLLRTLPELLTHHLEKRPDNTIYTYYDAHTKEWKSLTVRETCEKVDAWRRGFAALGLARGERAAMLLANGIDAILFDQSALADAYVPVPLHAIDTPGSSAYILNDSGARALFTAKLSKWKAIEAADHLPALRHVIITDEDFEAYTTEAGVHVMPVKDFLAAGEGKDFPAGPEPTDLAAIVYTSGTTGRPKGVMLTHRAILSNIVGVLYQIFPDPQDIWFSFLPLSHTFERTTSYYLALGMANRVAFCRSLGTIQEDLVTIRPTVMMSVPRIYERVYSKIQDELAKKPKYARKFVQWGVAVGWRRFCRENELPCEPSMWSFLDPIFGGMLDRTVGAPIRAIFGGRPHLFISGGAALNPTVARFFMGCGLDILQGYGLTEASPVICVNKVGSNHPQTVGLPLKNLEIRVGENDELQMRGPNVMSGYWQRDADTRASFTEDGWLKTGDQADIYDDGHVRIKGRIKEIIVTSTGEKIPPADVEQAIESDTLFDQAMVVGEDKPFIACLTVINPDQFALFIKSLGLNLDPADPETLNNPTVRAEALKRIRKATKDFPNFCVPRNVRLLSEPWSIDNGLMTPTLKIRRGPIRARYEEEISQLFGGKAR